MPNDGKSLEREEDGFTYKHHGRQRRRESWRSGRPGEGSGTLQRLLAKGFGGFNSVAALVRTEKTNGETENDHVDAEDNGAPV